ncbi:cation diffusion facilitator family transporter [Tenacibaculum sp. 190524A02b]|uniref:cation diffusion facilitator family transporter n=1 Tax=Tenacibaculum vairaonense TaxID=3137860 RepID=UPI0031FB0978
MGHHHKHCKHHNTTKNLATAFFLNLGFTIIEFIGGFFTNSLAIMSDALHDLGDSLSLGLAWYFEKKSSKNPTKKYSFGFKRLSILGALINSVVLIIGSVFIITEAMPRLTNPQLTNAKGMMWLAILGIVVNGVAVLKLKGGSSINEKVVSLHLLEDVLGWVAVLIASIIMQFWEIPILDPILSVLIAVFILVNVYRNIKESIQIILQGAPEGISIKEIEEELIKTEGINSVHDTRIWTMDGEYHVFTIHLVLEDNKNIEELHPLKKQLKNKLNTLFQLEHITLEFEYLDEECPYKNNN